MVFRRSLLCLAAVLCLVLCSCVPYEANAVSSMQKYSGTFYGAFDTIISLIGYAEKEETFNTAFAETQKLFEHYHRIYDAYNAYEGVNNLYAVNKYAGAGPVPAEPELIDLLLYMKELQPLLLDRVNVALGSVLSCWHEYRTIGEAVPPIEQLQALAEHCNYDDVIIDKDAGTVFFADPHLLLDVGAVAKGYACERAAEALLNGPMPSFIISAGGNVRCGLAPKDGRKHWGVGIQDPLSEPFLNKMLDVIYTHEMSVVTSGDYQRCYEVNGTRYHHIIDPDTLFPSDYMHGVTVLTQDSALADALSTCFFLLPYEKGRALADSLEGVEVYWVLEDGNIHFTDGMGALLQSQGASSLR